MLPVSLSKDFFMNQLSSKIVKTLASAVLSPKKSGGFEIKRG